MAHSTATTASMSLHVRLAEALLDVHRRTDLDGALDAAVRAAARLDAPCAIGCLLPGQNGSWRLAALVDGAADHVALGDLGLTPGPFSFRPPPDAAPRPLAQLAGHIWGAEGCRRIEQRLGTAAALCVPVRDASGIRGALLALLPATTPAPLVAELLAHAAIATARHLGRERHQAGAISTQAAFFAQAGHEISRAETHGRDLALVTVELANVAEMERIGPTLRRLLDRWDIVGRLDVDRPVLAIALPETSRADAHARVGGLGVLPAGALTGSASITEDSINLTRLIEIARGRAGLDAMTHGRVITAPGRTALPSRVTALTPPAQTGGAERGRTPSRPSESDAAPPDRAPSVPFLPGMAWAGS